VTVWLAQPRPCPMNLVCPLGGVRGVQATLRIQVLGSLRVWWGGRELDLGPPRRRAVLGLIALGDGETVTTRELVDALWGDRPPRSAVNVLQTHVKHLRRIMEPDRPPRSGSAVLPHVNGGYAVNQDAVDVDLPRFRTLLAEAETDDAGRAVELLGQALRRWRGSPLADLPFLGTHPKVVALAAKRREVLARYGDAMIATGAASEVLPELAASAAEQPLDEPTLARLVRAHHAVGHRAKAFQVYHDARHRLVEELGIDPGPELRAAHAALLHDDVPVARHRPWTHARRAPGGQAVP
jgi:DNA-binding SARP family transcriptional activator